MKNIIVGLVLITTFASVSVFANKASGLKFEKVYVCDAKGSNLYHYSRECTNLQRCTGIIAQEDMELAKKDGRKPCNLCAMGKNSKSNKGAKQDSIQMRKYDKTDSAMKF